MGDPSEVAELLRDFPARWWITAGWAIELFVGQRVRDHKDVDVLVLRSEQLAIQEHFPDWELRIAHEGKFERWPLGERIELPRHNVWAQHGLQFLLGEDNDGVWYYRRDPRIAMSVDELGLVSADGIPYVRPEIVLLFKSKAPEPHDEADLEAVLPALDAEGRDVLRGWLPAGHPWRERI
jgi:hypothetical protein